MGKKKKPNKFWDMKMSATDNKSADIFIYGEITKYAWEEYGEVSSISFKNELDELGDVAQINLYINSPGGSVFETMAIIAMLERHPADIISHIDGLAASCASVLPMISKQVIMPANALMMIHHAWTYASGNAAVLRKIADEIERISQSMCQYYLERAGDKLSADQLNEMLKEDTWLTAQQCLEYGLVDVVSESNQAVAYAFDDEWAKRYDNIPKQLQQSQPSPTMSADEMVLRQKIREEAEANIAYHDSILGGILY
ncbi:head maturation protease, ClpP-related [Sporosarcina sp. FSL W7-1283]|uniref:head maturation protease, ClpP-related n=1 Tax=Sporosarcina sp. FSL W7-1283 TaxID=2921560 RepID=UPI0030FBD394